MTQKLVWQLDMQDNLSKKADSAGSKLQSLGKYAAAAAAAIGTAFVAAGATLLKLGADAADMQSKTDAVFKDLAGAARDWSADFSDSVGANRYETQKMVADMGSLAEGFGVVGQESLDLSTKTVELAHDLAAFEGIGADEAIEKLRAGFSGSLESLNYFGAGMSSADVQMRAMTQTGKKQADQLTRADKIWATYSLVVEKTGSAQGAAAAKAEENSQMLQRLWNDVKQAATSISEKLTPAFGALLSGATGLSGGLKETADRVAAMIQAWLDNGGLEKIKDLVDRFTGSIRAAIGFVTDYWNVITSVATGLVAAAAAFGIIKGAILAYNAVIKIAKAVQIGFNLAMLANPIAAIPVVIGLVVTAWYLWGDTIKEFLAKVWNILLDGIDWLLQKLEVTVGYFNEDWAAAIAEVRKGVASFSVDMGDASDEVDRLNCETEKATENMNNLAGAAPAAASTAITALQGMSLKTYELGAETMDKLYVKLDDTDRNIRTLRREYFDEEEINALESQALAMNITDATSKYMIDADSRMRNIRRDMREEDLEEREDAAERERQLYAETIDHWSNLWEGAMSGVGGLFAGLANTFRSYMRSPAITSAIDDMTKGWGDKIGAKLGDQIGDALGGAASAGISFLMDFAISGLMQAFQSPVDRASVLRLREDAEVWGHSVDVSGGALQDLVQANMAGKPESGTDRQGRRRHYDFSQGDLGLASLQAHIQGLFLMSRGARGETEAKALQSANTLYSAYQKAIERGDEDTINKYKSYISVMEGAVGKAQNDLIDIERYGYQKQVKAAREASKERLAVIKTEYKDRIEAVKQGLREELDLIEQSRRAQLDPIEQAIENELELKEIYFRRDIAVIRAGNDTEAVLAARQRAQEEKMALEDRRNLEAQLHYERLSLTAARQDEIDAINAHHNELTSEAEARAARETEVLQDELDKRVNAETLALEATLARLAEAHQDEIDLIMGHGDELLVLDMEVTTRLMGHEDLLAMKTAETEEAAQAAAKETADYAVTVSSDAADAQVADMDRVAMAAEATADRMAAAWSGAYGYAADAAAAQVEEVNRAAKAIEAGAARMDAAFNRRAGVEAAMPITPAPASSRPIEVVVVSKLDKREIAREMVHVIPEELRDQRVISA